MNFASKAIAAFTAFGTIAACTNGTAPTHCQTKSIEDVANTIAAAAYHTDVDLAAQCQPIVFGEMAECGLEFSEYRDLVYTTMQEADEARILSNTESAYWNAQTNLIVKIDLDHSSCGSVSRHVPSQPVFQGLPSLIFDDK